MKTRYIEYAILSYDSRCKPYLDQEFLQQMKIVDCPETSEAGLAIKIDCDALEPLYTSGDILLLRIQPSVAIGELGMFVVGGLSYLMTFGGNQLYSVNPHYEELSLADEYYCKGLILGKLHPENLVQDLGYRADLVRPEGSPIKFK